MRGQRKFGTTRRQFLALAATLPLFSSCSDENGDLHTDRRTEFSIGWSIYAGWTPWEYAERSGIVKRWADRYGLRIDFVQMGDYVSSLELFKSGDIDGVTATLGDGFSLAAAGGRDTTVVLLNDYSNGNDGILSKAVSSITELRGRRIHLQKGSVSHYLLARALAKNGLDQSDVMESTGAAAISGNIGIRNEGASLWTSIQQIEYMIAIDFGRSFLDRFNAIACCSGAMTLFDAVALRKIGGFNAGSGQDLDVTLRLREAGHRVSFASRAWALTDGPETFAGLVQQRLRWDRDAIRIHIFQHHQLRKASNRESLGNTIQRYDFINFTLFPTLLLPFFFWGLFQVPGALLPDFLLAAYLLMLGVAAVILGVEVRSFGCLPIHLREPG